MKSRSGSQDQYEDELFSLPPLQLIKDLKGKTLPVSFFSRESINRYNKQLGDKRENYQKYLTEITSQATKTKQAPSKSNKIENTFKNKYRQFFMKEYFECIFKLKTDVKGVDERYRFYDWLADLIFRALKLLFVDLKKMEGRDLQFDSSLLDSSSYQKKTIIGKLDYLQKVLKTGDNDSLKYLAEIFKGKICENLKNDICSLSVDVKEEIELLGKKNQALKSKQTKGNRTEQLACNALISGNEERLKNLNKLHDSIFPRVITTMIDERPAASSESESLSDSAEASTEEDRMEASHDSDTEEAMSFVAASDTQKKALTPRRASSQSATRRSSPKPSHLFHRADAKETTLQSDISSSDSSDSSENDEPITSPAHNASQSSAGSASKSIPNLDDGDAAVQRERHRDSIINRLLKPPGGAPAAKNLQNPSNPLPLDNDDDAVGARPVNVMPVAEGEDQAKQRRILIQAINELCRAIVSFKYNMKQIGEFLLGDDPKTQIQPAVAVRLGDPNPDERNRQYSEADLLSDKAKQGTVTHAWKTTLTDAEKTLLHLFGASCLQLNELLPVLDSDENQLRWLKDSKLPLNKDSSDENINAIIESINRYFNSTNSNTHIFTMFSQLTCKTEQLSDFFADVATNARRDKNEEMATAVSYINTGYTNLAQTTPGKFVLLQKQINDASKVTSTQQLVESQLISKLDNSDRLYAIRKLLLGYKNDEDDEGNKNKEEKINIYEEISKILTSSNKSWADKYKEIEKIQLEENRLSGYKNALIAALEKQPIDYTDVNRIKEKIKNYKITLGNKQTKAVGEKKTTFDAKISACNAMLVILESAKEDSEKLKDIKDIGTDIHERKQKSSLATLKQELLKILKPLKDPDKPMKDSDMSPTLQVPEDSLTNKKLVDFVIMHEIRLTESQIEYLNTQQIDVDNISLDQFRSVLSAHTQQQQELARQGPPPRPLQPAPQRQESARPPPPRKPASGLFAGQSKQPGLHVTNADLEDARGRLNSATSKKS